MINARKAFKKLALILIFAAINSSLAKDVLITQEKFKTHLRWNIFVNKEDVEIIKKGKIVKLVPKTEIVFNKLKNNIKSLKKDKTYVQNIRLLNDESTMEIELVHEFIDVFSFFKKSNKKYVMDFWIDESFADTLNKKNKSISTFKKIGNIKKKKIANSLKKKSPTFTPKTKEVVKRKIKKKIADNIVINKLIGFRDYRYGSSFVWDYEALAPRFKKAINLSSKTPEYFYPIKNRDINKGEIESHLQLSINLFRKKKWGLMYKSIKIFNKTYGEETYINLNEYLKANAILRNNFEKSDKSSVKIAVNILSNIAERTTNYEMKRGVLKYLINYYLENKEYVQSLKKSKVLYVESKENFDIEESQITSEAILYNLAMLSQIDAIQDFLKEKTIRKLLPKQTLFAYEMYTFLKINRPDEVLNKFKKIKKELVEPIDRTILFNVAESYFRVAQYEKALKLFDKFIFQYSHDSYTSNSRIRLALCYELLEKDPYQTIELYKNSINRTKKINLSYEARLRYVGMKSIRKLTIKDSDKEIRSFLDLEEYEKKLLSRNNKKLLWLIRLRTFIVDKDWTKALSYLNAIPLNTMNSADRRVFEGDGAEIVYGIMTALYKESEYSKVIKIWTMYKDKYVAKVASDPFMNYIVGHSFVKLGLYDGFDRAYSVFEKIKDVPTKTYPIWTKKDELVNSERMLLELQLVRNMSLKNWYKAQQILEKLQKVNSKYNKINFYYGIIAYQLKQYRAVVEYIETYFANENGSTIHDGSELAEIILAYTDSLYELGRLEKYKNVAGAIVRDTKKMMKNNKYLEKVLERVAYYEIEILGAERKPASSLVLESKIQNFKSTFNKSDYEGRIDFLLAVAYLKNKKEIAGKKILNNLLSNEKTEGYIRELAKSELALIKIKETSI